MTDMPIVERTLDGQRGYVDGFRAGWRAALSGLRQGHTVDEVAAALNVVLNHLEQVLREQEQLS